MKLDDRPVHVRLKLAALWAAAMFCYIYGDYFDLFRPGKLASMLAGRTPVGPTTQGLLLGFAVMMTIPSLMVFLSLVLPPRVNRWANIVVGLIYTAIMAMIVPSAWRFMQFLGLIEIALTLSIVWHAWTWPKEKTP